MMPFFNELSFCGDDTYLAIAVWLAFSMRFMYAECSGQGKTMFFAINAITLLTGFMA